MADIKETKEMIKFVCAIANGAGNALEDGEVGWEDAMFIMDGLLSAPAAFDGADNIPAELADLSEAEVDELIECINEELDLPQDEIEGVLEDMLAVGVELFDLILRIKGLLEKK